MKLFSSLGLVAVLAITTFVVAQETSKQTDEGCSKCPMCTSATSAVATDKTDKCSKCTSATSAVAIDKTDETCEGGCPVATAMSKLPKMTYTVGTESTCCSESAAEMAKKHDAPIQYVVAEKTYSDKTEAYTALVESTEAYVNKFVTPAKCETSGTTTVAGKSCGCSVEAGKRAELVSTSIESIKMKYKVGDKELGCGHCADALAKEKGVETHYIVNGEETPCNLTARLKLATAKYEAAVKAIAAADQSAAATTPQTETKTVTSGT